MAVVDVTVQVMGRDAQGQAEGLRRALVAGQQAGDRVGPVQVERSAELVMAVIGLAFSGVGTAKTIWDWWQARNDSGDDDGVRVRVVFVDGESVELSSVDEAGLTVIVERRAAEAG